MPVTVQVIGSGRSLADIEQIINQTETGPFALVSLALGKIAGLDANVVTFAQAPIGGRTPISLKTVDGNISQQAQEDQINASGLKLVCYARLFVSGNLTNVAALRT
jgi:hypothetical protein